MLRRTCAVALAVLLTAVPAAYAHNASPDYLTQVNAVTPATKGVTVTVINRSDRLLLRNTSNADVSIAGYKGEPYARVKADGTVDNDVRVIRSLDTDLDQQAVIAARQWTFKPGTKDGKAVDVQVNIELSFTLK